MAIQILPSNYTFSHIVHVADIHIRLTRRHEEYKNVFEKFFDDVNKTPLTTAIFILGDLVNSKLDLSPECVDLAAEFLRGCANLRPTILIAGNHDTNLTNRNRLDSLSPIVDALDHPNLFYLKTSGLFALGNICINNYSVFDTVEAYLKGKDIPTIYRNKYDYFIATYHGQVDGAMTDIGFKLVNPAVTVNIFDHHDIVLMGDIHKLQDLQVYDDQENKPTIHYCGSMIQQKHDEPLTEHGYSLWDLENLEYKHIDIENDYGFFSILVDNGVISSDVTLIPKKARVRFQLKNTSATEIKAALLYVRTLTEVIEPSYQRLDVGIPLTRMSSTTGNVVLGDINDGNYQIKLIAEYICNKLKITDQSMINGVIKINNSVNDSVKKDDFARNIRWLPIRFEWENMFSYGEGNVIDFTKTKGLMGLFAANTSGKSSVFSALTFCLFDKCERESEAVNIMNTQTTTFNCKFEFEINGIRYFIKRDATTNKKGKVKVDVRFWKMESGQEIDLNGEQRRNTNEIIREYLGSYEDFVLTALSVQSGKNNVSIIDMGNTDRKDLFAQFMGLNVFDRLYTEGNERLKERLVVLRTYKNDDHTQKLIDYENFLFQADGIYNSEKDDLEVIDYNRKTLQQTILETSQKLIKTETNIPKLEHSQFSLDGAKLTIKINEASMIDTKTNISLLSTQLEQLEIEIKDLESKNLNDRMIQLQELTTKRQELAGKREQMKSSYLADLKIYEKAKNIDYDPDCSYCIKTAGTIAQDAKEAFNRMADIQDLAEVIKGTLELIETKISELSWVVDDNTKFMTNLRKRNELKDKKIRLNETLERLEKIVEKAKTDVKTYEKNIELYNTNIDSIVFNENIELAIKNLRKQLFEEEHLFKTKHEKILDIIGKISVCKNHILQIKNKIEEVKIIEQEYKLYEIYCQCVSRDGIPFDVIKATVPEIQNEVNSILSQICDFTTLFETDGKNVIPYIVYDGRKWLMSLTSGFEKFALSLAMRVALINISNLPRPNFLIIDEGFGVLDAENLSMMNSLFTYLKTNFDFILIVSHLETLRDMVDSHIEITKYNGFSKVNFK